MEVTAPPQAVIELIDGQKSKLGQLLDKLTNDIIEGCTMQCDAVAQHWCDKEAKSGSNKEYMRMVGAQECANAVREMKW